MQNLIKPMVVIKKHRSPVKMRCGSVISTITFPERKDGRVQGEVKYHTDYSIVPKVTWGLGRELETPKWI